MKDIRIFSKETEDQPSHKVVQLLPALRFVPIRVFLQQLNIEAVEATRSPDIKGILTDLLDCCNACQRQEKPKVVMKVGIIASNSLTIRQVFRLKTFAICGKGMNFALYRVVAGLSRKAVRVVVTSPSGQTFK